MEGVLIPSVTPLTDLCGRLGISPKDLATAETPNAIAGAFRVNAADAGQLDISVARAFADQYGDSAMVQMRIGELTELTIHPALTEAELAKFVAGVAAGGPYEAIVTVDKMAIAARLVGSGVGPVRLFFFADALKVALARGITWFETNVWINAPGRLTIIVLDTDSDLVGRQLAVLGGSALEKLPTINELAPLDPGRRQLDFAAIGRARDRQIGWDNAWARALQSRDRAQTHGPEELATQCH